MLFLTFTAPGDYESVQNLPLTFEIGHAINSSLCVDVDIFDDEIVEFVEYFSVSLTSSDPVYINPVSEANVSIFDNDRMLCTAMTLALSPSSLPGLFNVHEKREGVWYLMKHES